MKKFIAFSGGVESTTMCVLFGASAQPIFTDTGFEDELMYERLELVERILKVRHGPQFSILKIQAQNVEGTGTNTLPDYIRKRKFYPSGQARFCTRLFKIKPMDDFLRQQGPSEVMIGLNFDEADDRVGNYGECKNAKYSYPLVDARITRPQCEFILANAGLLPNFPAYMRRGGCVGCFYKGKKEFEAMALMAPEKANALADLEDSIQDERENHFGIVYGIPNMRKFIRDARTASLFRADEIYPKSVEQTPCGVFCHR